MSFHSYDLGAVAIYYAVIIQRIFIACQACATHRSRIVIALFEIPSFRSVYCQRKQSRLVREFGKQLWQQPIRITVLGGVLVLNYALLGSV